MDVTLPSGATATVTEVSALTAGDKLKIQSGIVIATKGGEMAINMALSEEMKVAAIAHLVVAWSFEEVPSVERVLKLGLKDYNALAEAVKEHMAELGLGASKSGS